VQFFVSLLFTQQIQNGVFLQGTDPHVQLQLIDPQNAAEPMKWHNAVSQKCPTLLDSKF